MIDHEAVQAYLERYKKAFPKNWKNEMYKWEALKQFRKYWDIEAENFADMLNNALSKTKNLLASGFAYPKAMLIEFAEADPEATRSAMRNLFDESKPVADRVEAFIAFANDRKENHNVDGWKNHYQDLHAISVYLWLRYPEKYYIYKYGVARPMAKTLKADFVPKKTIDVKNLIATFAIYDEMNELLQADEEIKNMVEQACASSGYEDPSLHTATCDFGFYITAYYPYEKKDEWYPSLEEYNPGLTVDDWKKLLQDPEVFSEGSLTIMTRFMEMGGAATCKQLSTEYGETPNYYNGNISALGKRIAEKTGCPLRTEQKHERYWPVVFVGKVAGNDAEGTYIYKLRDELMEALDSSISCNDTIEHPCIWKISHGSGTNGLTEDQKQDALSRCVTVVSQYTKAKGKSQTTQGEQYMYEIKNGDYFYLCYGSEVKLFGRFDTDTVNENPIMEPGWMDRHYQVIAETKISTPYTADSKWWAPNNNSTCIPVGPTEWQQFENMILKPYFDLSISDIFGGNTMPKYTVKDFLDEVYMDESQYQSLSGLLRKKKNVILQGAPGVGKTFTAKRLAYAMMGVMDDSRIECVQFHQNYSYEDFIMGYKPNDDGFILKKGIFYNFCKKAEQDPSKEYFFIIDEINRGNMSKIFGELLMLIEADYRGKRIALAYNGELFSVPENLYLIGMMNTADRSLAMIDYALRRRFSFYTMEPGFLTEGFTRYQKEMANETFDQLIEKVRELNKDIMEDGSLGAGFRIGHSYFCNQKECTDEWMKDVVYYDLIPMLQEYWFDNPDKFDRWDKELRGVVDDQ